MIALEEQILSLLKKAPEQLMSFRQLIRELDLDDSERHEIRQILHEMVKSGNVIKLKGRRLGRRPASPPAGQTRSSLTRAIQPGFPSAPSTQRVVRLSAPRLVTSGKVVRPSTGPVRSHATDPATSPCAQSWRSLQSV